MAKGPIPVGSVKAEAIGSYGPATWANVFYLDVTAGASTPGEVIAAVVTYMKTFYSTVISAGALLSTWQIVHWKVSYRDAEDSLVRLTIADAFAGTATGTGQDAQVSYLFNWGTGDPRKGGKPRQYVCGVPQAHLADSARLDSTILSDINGRIITFLEAGPTQTIPMQLVEMSFRNGNADRVEGVTFPIIGGSLNQVVATQRRRVDRLRS